MSSRPENLSFGKYRFVVELGSGGMGDVFLSVVHGPKGFSKLQVIKRLRPDLAEDPEFLTMFMNEARLAARLNHPNVVQTNEVGEDSGQYFMAMEYLEGQSLYMTLRRAAQRGAALPLAMHLRVLAEVCAGLHYAHELADFDGSPLEVVHRDCSPQNVFITYDGGIKVLDFGIAKAADSAQTTRTGVLKGKVPYMAPEQLEGSRVDRRADIFAVGAMLWEAATGTRLWKGLNDIQIAHRLHQGDIPPPRTFNPNIDPRLEAVCMRALAVRPAERYQTAADLHVELERVLEAIGPVTAREVGRFVASHFLDSRKELRSKIETELRAVLPPKAPLPPGLTQSGEAARVSQSGEHRPISDSGALHIVPMTPISSSHPQLPSPRSRPSATPSGGAPVARTPTSGSHAARTPSSGAQAVAAVAPETVPALPSAMSADESLNTIANGTLTHASPLAGASPSRKASPMRAIGIVGAGLVIVTVILVVVMRSSEKSSSSSGPPSAPTTGKTTVSSVTATKSTASPSAVAQVALAIEAHPKEAKIFLDDVAVAGNPHSHDVAVDGELHEIRVEAPGYATRKERVRFEPDMKPLKINLERLGKASTVTTATTAPPEPSASTGKKPVLDKDDPWK